MDGESCLRTPPPDPSAPPSHPQGAAKGSKRQAMRRLGLAPPPLTQASDATGAVHTRSHRRPPRPRLPAPPEPFALALVAGPLGPAPRAVGAVPARAHARSRPPQRASSSAGSPSRSRSPPEPSALALAAGLRDPTSPRRREPVHSRSRSQLAAATPPLRAPESFALALVAGAFRARCRSPRLRLPAPPVSATPPPRAAVVGRPLRLAASEGLGEEQRQEEGQLKGGPRGAGRGCPAGRRTTVASDGRTEGVAVTWPWQLYEGVRKKEEEQFRLRKEDPSLEESDGEDTRVPEVGMVFNNHTEVNRFYRKYARRVGFGVMLCGNRIKGSCCHAGITNPEGCVVENGIVPAGYIGLPSNVQQFMGNQAAIRPSIVYMVPSGVDPHAFGSGVLMPVMYQQMFQVPQKPNETVPGTSANGKKERPRSQKPTETSQQSNGTPGPASG
ncbi:hypothetical protein PR202_ga01938 [Eleusine coracana subsp. coracana]|uniref:Uncharacterized protein n=1 Tax=Eleusine coracana subsp. coracana TaxID=191504 RepID=A0AAV5BGD2_ELECO|nr:hypothetical protein PR202_ga01251 [Eleusine coracana subsp. coracana]GJM86114.1 hypothetical protein PR202_ga01938 [Eleusine coracana subsp. coracana]